jgi:hypothetical protein
MIRSVALKDEQQLFRFFQDAAQNFADKEP